MTSDVTYKEAYVWVWLPGASEPVVAGRLAREGRQLIFNYGRSYLDRVGAIPIYEPELPLRAGALPLLAGLSMPGCIRDAAPDAWGRRVIVNKKFGRAGKEIDPGDLDELTYLLESGSDRIGALDFQSSASAYKARTDGNISLEDLLNAAERVEQGLPLAADLDQALFHGSSLGGARPKALINDENKKYIAKFSSLNDVTNVVKAEYVAMRLAALVGLQAAPVKLARAGGKDVLLIERFDREKSPDGWRRKAVVSALTILGLDELMARYASYDDLATAIRHRFTAPKETLHELFGRLVFNILCGNTDDHARNHAAFWDGKSLSLTPAYDICPQARSGREATQAMLITGNNRFSRITACLEAASQFSLSSSQALAVVTHQMRTIIEKWDAVTTEAKLTTVERNFLWRRQFLNPFAFDGAPDAIVSLAPPAD